MKQISIFLVAVAVLASCSQNADKTAELEKLKSQRDQLNIQISQLEDGLNLEEKPESKGIAVNITEAETCDFNHYIRVQGIVDGDQNIAVSPQMPGIVTAVYVTEGSNVTKGQILAELDVQVLKQSIEEVKTQLDLASIIFQKQSTLWEKKIGSEVQYLQAKNNKESLDRRLSTLAEQVKMSQLVSPINGTIESIPLRVGQMASPGVPNSTVRVINMSVAKISADVSETYAMRIKDGNSALVSFPDIGVEIETKLNFTSHYIDPTNRTFKVECKISGREFELRANMIAYVKIKDYTNKNAFCIPVNYIQNNQDGKFILIAAKNGADWTAEKRIIKTGMDYDGIVEVLDGVNAGEKIITAGFQNLNPGQKVTF